MIHTLTAFTGDGKDQRVFGYHESERKAMTAAILNEGSMCETIYEYLLIEEVAPEVHGAANCVAWYQWAAGWIPCEAPPWSEGVTNFSMG